MMAATGLGANSRTICDSVHGPSRCRRGEELRYLKDALSLMGRQRNARVLQTC